MENTTYSVLLPPHRVLCAVAAERGVGTEGDCHHHLFILNHSLLFQTTDFLNKISLVSKFRVFFYQKTRKNYFLTLFGTGKILKSEEKNIEKIHFLTFVGIGKISEENYQKRQLLLLSFSQNNEKILEF